MKKITAIIIALLLVISVYGCGSGTTTRTADDYDDTYGHGKQYDEDVRDVAEAFGEDPDHVNDVCEALADEIR